MIKLVAMLLFVIVGAGTGSLFFRLFAQGKLSLSMCIGIGVLGAFAGLLLADLADIRLVGNLIDGLIFSTIGSLLLLVLNLLIRNNH